MLSLPARLSIGRASVAYCHDLVMAALSFGTSLALRLGDDVFSWVPSEQIFGGTVLFTLICALVFRVTGLYRGVWRYASTRDMLAIARAAILSILIFLPLMFFITRLGSLPRSLPILMWFVLVFFLGAPRFAYRLWRDRSLSPFLEDGTSRIPVLLAGDGDGAETFIRASERNRNGGYRVVGMLSEKPQRVGMRIRHVPVLGTLDQLPRVIKGLRIREGARPQRLVLTRDDFSRPLMNRFLEQGQALGLTLARLPRMEALRDIDDKIEVRPIALEDLLGRPQSVLDRAAMARLIAGRRVLVTGAGGSIGGELVRQIAALGPSALSLVEASELALYTIDMEMAQSHPTLARRSYMGDVRDSDRLHSIFTEARPDLVVHAAALKHVPLVESNPLEGLRTNVLGTRNVGEACRRHGVELMVMISTDKAVNPTNVMGATKRVAELYCQAADVDGQQRGKTRFVTVRFGNVLGSTGSVVPLFRRQLEWGGPLTVTHPHVTRYFMTIREAVELVLQASAMDTEETFPENLSHGGRLFVLDMGEPVKIVDLARQMIRLAGLEPDKDIAITYTGLRPGEKLYEEIFHGGEAPVKTKHDSVRIAAPRLMDKDDLDHELALLETTCSASDLGQALDILRRLVPEYETPPPSPS